MMTVDELKEVIVTLMVENKRLWIPEGHCPYAYLNIGGPDPRDVDGGCNDCDLCKAKVYERLEERYRAQIAAL